jgi:hypothetical protein
MLPNSKLPDYHIKAKKFWILGNCDFGYMVEHMQIFWKHELLLIPSFSDKGYSAYMTKNANTFYIFLGNSHDIFGFHALEIS